MKQRFLHLYYTLLGKLAKHYLRRHQPKIIGINGSVGKTSCRMIIFQTLQQFLPNKKISTSPKNFNGELGLSLSILEITKREPKISCFLSTLRKCLYKALFGKKSYDIIVLEYGIDTPNEMEFILNIAKPDIGVFTAIDAVHSEQFGSPDAIAAEEIKMALNTKEIVFLNANDDYAMQLYPRITIDKFTYQTAASLTPNTKHKEKKADLRYDNIEFTLHQEKDAKKKFEIKSAFSAFLKGRQYKVETNLLGKANYGYITLALVIAEILSGKAIANDNEQIKTTYKLQPGRMSFFAGKYDTLILDSTYNAAPRSMREVINTAIQIRSQLFPQREIWLILGDMRELGDFTEQEHRKLAGYVSQSSDQLFLLGTSMTKFLADELEKIWFDLQKLHLTKKREKLNDELDSLLKSKQKNEEPPILVFKGSQNTIFLEESVKYFLQDASDQQYLTRQSSFRLQKKQN